MDIARILEHSILGYSKVFTISMVIDSSRAGLLTPSPRYILIPASYIGHKGGIKGADGYVYNCII